MTAPPPWSSTPGWPLSHNASGALFGQAHISRCVCVGLRLCLWRVVWPMLRFNPVMAAKYEALTRAADAAVQVAWRWRRCRDAACHGGGGRGQGAARHRPRGMRAALAAALDLLHGRPRHQLGSRGCGLRAPASTPPVTSRRQPDQRVSRTRLGAPDLPPRGGGQRARRNQDQPRGKPWAAVPRAARSFSPARLNAVGATVPPVRAGSVAACTTSREKTRATGTRAAPDTDHSSRRGTSACLQPVGLNGPTPRGSQARTAPPEQEPQVMRPTTKWRKPLATA